MSINLEKIQAKFDRIQEFLQSFEKLDDPEVAMLLTDIIDAEIELEKLRLAVENEKNIHLKPTWGEKIRKEVERYARENGMRYEYVLGVDK